MKQFTNIEEARLAILTSVNFGELVENFKPTTMQGHNIKTEFTNLISENSVSSVFGLSRAIEYADRYSTIEEQLKTFKQDATERMNENLLTSQLVYTFESIANVQRNSIVRDRALVVLDEMVAMSESEIKASVRAGKLNPFRSLPCIPLIIEACAINTASGVDTADVKVSHPISYIEESTEGIHFRSGERVYLVNENGIQETVCPNQKFLYVSSIVEAMEFDTDHFKFSHPQLGDFKISENGIERKNTEEVFESMSNTEFTKKMSLVIEGFGIKADVSGNATKAELTKTCDAILALSENFDGVAELDNVFEAVNKSTGDKALLLNNNTNFHILMVESKRQAKIVESFTDIREALSRFETKVGVNLCEQFTNEINEAVSTDAAITESISEHQDLLNKLVERKEAVEKEISDTDDEEVKEEFTATLQAIEVAIVETKESMRKVQLGQVEE